VTEEKRVGEGGADDSKGQLASGRGAVREELRTLPGS
jgi:hypothetical protein